MREASGPEEPTAGLLGAVLDLVERNCGGPKDSPAAGLDCRHKQDSDQDEQAAEDHQRLEV